MYSCLSGELFYIHIRQFDICKDIKCQLYILGALVGNTLLSLNGIVTYKFINEYNHSPEKRYDAEGLEIKIYGYIW